MKASAPATIQTPTDRCCELCGKADPVLVEMAPGPDGLPWFLCVTDYIEGRRPQQLGNIPAEYKVDIATPPKRRAG